MRVSIIIFLVLLLIGCNDNQYAVMEFQAIQDIANDCLKTEELKQNEIMTPPPPESDDNQIDSDQVVKVKKGTFKVFVSDALLPISQIKEDNQLMFDKVYIDPRHDSLFNSIVVSNNFSKLKYREFDKSKLKLFKPYQQFTDRKKEVRNNEEYKMLNFSRICFSADYRYGVVVIDYQNGCPNGVGGGFRRPYLIEKKNNEWKIIEENKRL